MKSAFTLIELLVVIAIIGILSTAFLVVLNGARESAMNTRAQAELNNIVKLIQIAREENNQTLMEITSDGCSDCPCRAGDEESNACIDGMTLSFNNIATALGEDSFINQLYDPWGRVYMFDENENRPSNACSQDNFRSVGADGSYGTIDDITLTHRYPLLTSSCYE